MHALALVLGDVETAMEPYDENLTVEPFWEPYDTEWLLKRWPQFRSLVTAHFLLERFQKEWAEEGDLYRVSPDGKGIEYWTDSNPAGRWDYWSTGGRFSDHLMLKPNHRGIHGERSSGSVPAPFEPRRCDGGLLGAMDLERMRVRSVIDAAARWDRWHAGPDIEDPMSVEEFPEWILGYDRGDFIERAGWRLCPVTCWSLPIDGSRSRSAGGGRRMPVSVLPIWST